VVAAVLVVIGLVVSIVFVPSGTAGQPESTETRAEA
jgi:hypothetical protein